MPDGSLNLFVTASNAHTYQQVWSSASGWSGWIDRGTAGGTTSSSPAALTMPDGSLNTFVVESGALYQDVWGSSSGWTGWIYRGSPSGGF